MQRKMAQPPVLAITLVTLAMLINSANCWYQLTDLLSSCNGALAPTETGIVSAKGFTDGALPDCHLLLKAMPGRTLVLSIENLQVRNTHLFHRQCDNYIQILSGSSVNNTAKAVSRKICSHASDQQEFTVSDRYARVQLHSSGSKYVHFQMVYTNALPAAQCEPNMFSCKSTGTCINKDLVCDRHNNCGDHSDENHELKQCQIVTYYHVNLAVSLACSLIVLLTLGFAIFYCTRPREPRWLRLKKAGGVGSDGGSVG